MKDVGIVYPPESKYPPFCGFEIINVAFLRVLSVWIRTGTGNYILGDIRNIRSQNRNTVDLALRIRVP